MPDVALIDPLTTSTLDAYLSACTGLDALTHAIEAVASNASSPITDLLALEAVRLVSGNLMPVLSDLKDMTLRGKMMLGSLYAGLAFSNASLGAVHAMAHSLGGLLDLPHGHCNALLLPYVVDFNFDAASEGCLRVGEALGLQLQGKTRTQQKQALLGELERLKRETGIAQTLGQIGASRRDIPRLAEHAMQDACMVTNPRRPESKDIEAIYEKAF